MNMNKEKKSTLLRFFCHRAAETNPSRASTYLAVNMILILTYLIRSHFFSSSQRSLRRRSRLDVLLGRRQKNSTFQTLQRMGRETAQMFGSRVHPISDSAQAWPMTFPGEPFVLNLLKNRNVYTLRGPFWFLHTVSVPQKWKWLAEKPGKVRPHVVCLHRN